MEMTRHLKVLGTGESLLTAWFKVPKYCFQCKIANFHQQYHWTPLRAWNSYMASITGVFDGRKCKMGKCLWMTEVPL